MSALQTENHSASQTKPVLLAAALFFVTFAIFFQVRHFEFVNLDDDVYVFENPYIRNGFTAESVRWAFQACLTYQTPHCDYWQPLTFLSRILDIEWFGLNPAGHHLINLAFHLANGLILFFFLARFTRSPVKSFVVAYFFALHPVQVEPVAWVTARKDMLSTFFALLAMITYARSRTQKSWSSACHGLSLFLYTLVMLSKPIFALPFILLLLDFWPLERFSFRSGSKEIFKILIEKLPFFFISLLGLASLKSETLGKINWSLPTALLTYRHYVVSFFWPFKLGVSGSGILPPTSTGEILWISFLFTGTSYWVVRSAEKYRFLAVGWFWFLVNLAPVAGTQGSAWGADRFLYLPTIALSIVLVWGASEILKTDAKRKMKNMAAGGVLLAMTLVTLRQAGYWKNNRALYQRAVDINATNFVAQNNLGNIFAGEGKKAEAVQHFQKSLAMNPKYGHAYVGLGGIAAAEGRIDQAIFYNREAVKHNPSLAPAYFNLGNLLLSQEKTEEAIESYQGALRLDPLYWRAHAGLGGAYAKKNQWKESAFHFAEALKLKPNSKEAQEGLKTARDRLDD